MTTVHTLWILPTDETLTYLQSLFQSTPLTVNWDSLGVEIASSRSPIKTGPESRSFNAFPGSMDIWYDTATTRSYLLLPLIPSPKMARRHEEVGNVWGRNQFRPVMSLGELQTNRRNHKSIINSISTALIDTAPVLQFHCEMVIEDDSALQVAPFSDFYRDYTHHGGVSNQVMLEADEGIE